MVLGIWHQDGIECVSNSDLSEKFVGISIVIICELTKKGVFGFWLERHHINPYRDNRSIISAWQCKIR